MKLLPRPICRPPTSEQRFGRKLAKLIATMRRLPAPPAKAQPQPSITNGMTAYAKWDSLHDGAML